MDDFIKYNLKPDLIEPFLRKHTDIIETFTWVPCDLQRVEHLKLNNIKLSDYSKKNQ